MKSYLSVALALVLAGCQSVPLFQATYTEERVEADGVSKALILARLAMLKEVGVEVSDDTAAIVSVVKTATNGITYRFGVVPFDGGFHILAAVDGFYLELFGTDYADHYRRGLQAEKRALLSFLKTGRFN